MTETLYVGLFTFLLGLFLGNRMSLSRERRKEFNEVAVRIRVALKSRAKDPRPHFSNSEKIDAKDTELFLHLLSAWKRPLFKRAWSKYEAECKNTEQDSFGQAHYKQPDRVAQALERVVAYTGLR